MICGSITDPAVIRQALAAGALAFVPKTAPASVLEAALRDAAQGQQHLTAEVTAALGGVESAPQLTSREHQVVTHYLSGDGTSMANVAQPLGITLDTVKGHLHSVRTKFKDGTTPLTRIGLRNQLITAGWLH